MIDRTNRNFIAPSIQQQQVQPQTTALAPVQPIASRALIESHNRLIDVYAQQAREAAKVGEVVTDHNEGNAPRGYSSSSELQARNRRFFVTIGALVGGAAFGIWGIVSVAHAAGVVGDNWTLPLWIALTGVSAFVTIRAVHGSEQRLSLENLELNRQDNDFAIGMKDAETRRLAIQYAGRAELERVRLQQSQVDAQREAGRRLALETQAKVAQQMVRHTTPQSSLNRLNAYRPTAQSVPQRLQEAPQASAVGTPIVYEVEPDTAPIIVAEPVEPITDPVRQTLLDFVADLYLDRDPATNEYRKMHPNGQLRKGVVAPMSKRSSLTQQQRRQLQELLRQITPALFEYDETAKLWTLNLAHYRRVHHAVTAIDSTFTPATTWGN